MTDADQLEELRARFNWPRKTLDPLAVEAAAKGRLVEAVWEADRLMGYRVKPSSNSSVTVSPAQVPISEFSHLDNRSNYWYQRLWIQLHLILGRDPLSEWKDEDC